MRVAVVDIGSNTFRLLISLVRPDGGLSTLHIERKMLQLGAVVGRHGHIPDEQFAGAVAAIRSMGQFIERFGVDRIFPVATAALREASNGPEVADELGRVLGTPVRVITGLQEAALSYLGVSAAVDFGDSPRAVLDLGGGSLELALGDTPTMLDGASWPVGVSRISALVDQPERVDSSTRDLIRTMVSDHVIHGPVAPGTSVVLIGGSIRALARHVADRTSAWVPHSLNQMTITRADLELATEELLPLDVRERVDIHSIDPERAASLPIAGLIITEAMRILGIEEAKVSDWGLRTGVILDSLGIEPPAGPEVRLRSVRALREEFLPGDPHPAHVANLARQLLDQTSAIHGLTERECELIETAAHVHDIGRALALDGHHRHSAYLVEYADLRGLSPDDLAMVLSLVRSHRGGPPKISYPPFRAMSPEQRRKTRMMAAMLQLADALDRPRDGSIQRVLTADTGDSLLIRTLGASVESDRGAMQGRLDYAQSVLGRRIEFVSSRTTDDGRGAGHSASFAVSQSSVPSPQSPVLAPPSPVGSPAWLRSPSSLMTSPPSKWTRS